jgi:methyl-accepting chemotaxis protein
MTNKTASAPSRFVSVQWLLLISVTTLLTVILAGTFYWYYQFSTRQMLQGVTRDLTHTVKVAALNVNGDDMLALSQKGKPNAAGIAWQKAKNDKSAQNAARQQYGSPHNGFSDDPQYQALLNWLDIVHKIEPRAWPYVWVNDEPAGEIIYIVDLGARYNPEKSTLFLERDKDEGPTTELSLFTNQAGELESYTDDWGEWYSAWMPVNDSKGQLIGGVGIDFQAGEVRAVQQTIRNTLLVAFFLAVFVMALSIFFISRMITRPIAALTEVASEVGEGNYEHDFTSLYRGRYFHNEVGVLAHVFSLMVDKIQQRVTTLQQQVQELRIEIDQSKRQKHVDEIAGTKFFQELKVKAGVMRHKRDKKKDS